MSRAPRPTDRTAKPRAPATTIQAPAITRPIHPIRITTGSWVRAGARVRLAGRRRVWGDRFCVAFFLVFRFLVFRGVPPE